MTGAGTLAFLGPGGSAGQGLEALVSLNGALLVGTGLSLAWQRLRSWSAARKRSTRSLESPGRLVRTAADVVNEPNGILEEVP